jgi:hypothetical protein
MKKTWRQLFLEFSIFGKSSISYLSLYSARILNEFFSQFFVCKNTESVWIRLILHWTFSIVGYNFENIVGLWVWITVGLGKITCPMRLPVEHLGQLVLVVKWKFCCWWTRACTSHPEEIHGFLALAPSSPRTKPWRNTLAVGIGHYEHRPQHRFVSIYRGRNTTDRPFN